MKLAKLNQPNKPKQIGRSRRELAVKQFEFKNRLIGFAAGERFIKAKVQQKRRGLKRVDRGSLLNLIVRHFDKGVIEERSSRHTLSVGAFLASELFV